jgi:hypothetical protein
MELAQRGQGGGGGVSSARPLTRRNAARAASAMSPSYDSSMRCAIASVSVSDTSVCPRA